MIKFMFVEMLQKLAINCVQLTLVQSVIVIKNNFYTVGISKKRIKKKIKSVYSAHNFSTALHQALLFWHQLRSHEITLSVLLI